MSDAAPQSSEFSKIPIATLDGMTPEKFDALPFGVIGMSSQGLVEIYNTTESKMAGLRPAKVIGTHLFHDTAPCMNNFLVAQRFEDEPELDATLDYVLTFRMRPTSVRLRLLRSASASRRYLLVQVALPK